MIDSHCHLADEVFAGDVAAVIARARDAGVEGALCILDAGHAEERARAARLADQWEGLRFALGVHPHRAGAWARRHGEAVETVAAGVESQPGVRAIGEIGLDYHYDFAPRAEQQALFAAQIDLAVRLEVPVVIHAREADDDAIDVLREAGRGRLEGVMHCFTGSSAFARRALDIGFHISLAGIVTFPKATNLHEVATLVPADRLLIETDSPFLAPVPYRGKRNEPAWVVRVGEHVAALRGVTRAALAAETTANYRRLFRA